MTGLWFDHQGKRLSPWWNIIPPSTPAVDDPTWNDAMAAVRPVTTVISGESPPAEVARRLAICQVCPSKAYLAATDTCARCGCALVVRRSSLGDDCPDGHW